MDESGAVAPAQEHAPNPAPLVVVAFLGPWAFVSALLPEPWRWYGFGLVALLGLILTYAATWSHRAAAKRGEDPAHWAFLTVLTLGLAMLALMMQRPHDAMGRFCVDCGREGACDEPFCFGCGSTT